MKWDNILPVCRKYKCFPSMERFFSTCPILIRNYLTLSSSPAKRSLTEAGSPCGTVYILVFGRLQVTKEETGEVPCSFPDIAPSGIVGDYELFSGDIESSVTVQAREPSACPTTPARFYLQWISADSVALFSRTRLLMKKPSLQLNSNRCHPLTSHGERCTYAICQETGKVSLMDGVFRLKLNWELLAIKTGCSPRTVHRLLEEMEHKDILALSGRKILLTSTQLENIMDSPNPYS